MTINQIVMVFDLDTVEDAILATLSRIGGTTLEIQAEPILTVSNEERITLVDDEEHFVLQDLVTYQVEPEIELDA